jgi:stage IV sporulation protein FB
MKTIFKIHPLTYLIMLSVFICGYFNYFLIISFILLFHDLGHILLIKLFKYHLNYIEILPFGSIINSDINSSIKSTRLFLISIIGIFNQCLLYIIFYYLSSIGFINDISYSIFLRYNSLIIIFNMIPIIPLDGSKILLSIFESLIPYKKSLILINIISLINIIIIFIYNKMSLNLLLILLYLLIKTYIEIKNHEFIFNNFLLERYLNKKDYKKIIKVKRINSLHKNRYNFINNQREETILNKRYN